MATLSRFVPLLARSTLYRHPRQLNIVHNYAKRFLAINSSLVEDGSLVNKFQKLSLQLPLSPQQLFARQFHAADSKIHYLDFRHRFKTNHLRLHLLIIRRQKMKKHQRNKFRKRFKSLLAKQRLKREIAKEKAFRVELLSMIRQAESFNPKEYALRKIAEINNRPVELSKEEKFEQLKELIRKNRYQVDYIKPKHKRAEI